MFASGIAERGVTLGHNVGDVAIAVTLSHDDWELAASVSLTVKHDAGLLDDVDRTAPPISVRCR